MTFSEIKEQLERMTPEQLEQVATAFVVRKGGDYATTITLLYETGDALLEEGNAYFLVG